MRSSRRKRSFRAAFGGAAKLASRAWKRRRTGQSKTTGSSFTFTRNGQDSTPVTTQNDAVIDFRSRKRKRGPRAKRGKLFRRKVTRVIQSQYPVNRVLHQSVMRLQTAQNFTDAVSYQLYGGDGVRDQNINPCSDLRHVFIESLSGLDFGTGTGTPGDKALEFDQQSDQTSPITQNELGDPRIFFSGGLMETTFRNTHATNDCIVEVYQYITRATPLTGVIGGTTPGFNSPLDAYAAGFAKQHPILSEGTGPAGLNIKGGPTQGFRSVGTTPFQSRLFTKYFRVVKRTRYRLGPGQEASFVHHFSKRFSLQPSQVRGRSCLRGITNGFIFQVQGSPGIVGAVPVLALPADVTFTNIRHYNIKYFPGITGVGSLNATGDLFQNV